MYKVLWNHLDQNLKKAPAPAVFLEIGHVHVQPRQDHDVQEAGRSREDDAAIAQNQVQAVGADHRTCDDEPQQIGDFEFVQ